MRDQLVVNGLSVSLQNKSILSDINFSLAKGEILGLVGPSGCGKTTLLNTLAGFIDASDGEIKLLDGRLINNQKVIAAEQRNIGVIFQDYALFPHLTIEQNIQFGIQSLAKEQRIEKTNDVLALLKLTSLAERFPHQLSGGQQQRVAIARAIVREPQLLLLDEPFSNIDARLRNELMFELRRLLKSLNITAIFVTHNKDEVFTFADKIALLHQGSMIQIGEPAKVFAQPNSWQVADFLQIGSWLPVKFIDGKWHSALGCFSNNLTEDNSEAHYQLLVKAENLEIGKGEANCQISHINFTERGYHYQLSSLTDDRKLAFQHLSFYSEQVLALGQKLSLVIKPHDYQVFQN